MAFRKEDIVSDKEQEASPEAAQGAVPDAAHDSESSEPLYAGMTRRTLLCGAGGLAAMLALGCVKFMPAQAVVRPPGAQDEDAFLAACTRCGRCVEACPRHAIKLSHLENGVLTARTPEMSFYSNYCDFCAEENGGVPKCAAGCPTRAISMPVDDAPETHAIGRAVLIEDWCLAYCDTGCQACYNACPYEAMALDEYGRPYVLADRCNGCGACEAACVSLTNGSRSLNSEATSRAITVRPIDKEGR